MKSINLIKLSLGLTTLFFSLGSFSSEQDPGDYDSLCKCITPASGSGEIRQIPVLIRDFKKSHPDFQRPDGEIASGWDLDIVKNTLGSDGRPVYKKQNCPSNPNQRCTNSTFGKDYFNQWYKTIAGTNLAINKTLELDRSNSGTYKYRYSDSTFFPIDGEGFGNQGYAHNYHFTLETHMKFFYVAGSRLSFNGDDDLWIYINGKLAINIGGVHGATRKTVNLDSVASQLGIEPGNSYSFDMFFAERRAVNSSFTFETTFELECL